MMENECLVYRLDVNPVPIDIRPRALTTAIDLDDNTASLDLAREVAVYFDLSRGEAYQIIKQVGTAVSQWRRIADGAGLTASEIDRMASAFDHADLKDALR